MIPIGLTVTWRKLTRTAVVLGSIIGAILGMLAWFIGCWKIYGAINITNMALPYSAVCSGLAGLLFSGIITVGVSLASASAFYFCVCLVTLVERFEVEKYVNIHINIDPADYNFHDTRNMASLDDDLHLDQHVEEDSDSARDTPQLSDPEKVRSSSDVKEPMTETDVQLVEEGKKECDGDVTRAELKSAFKRALIYSTILTAIVTIIGTLSFILTSRCHP